ncbi:MAG: zinc-binding alcohol dehydrogenase family protein [Bacteroidota bacterium]
MRTLICQQPGQFTWETHTRPTPGPGEALLKIQSVGICGTDLHAFAGNQPFFQYPRILGHEMSGQVVSLPPGEHAVKVGENVVISPYDYCGTCIACRQGKTNCCANLKLFGIHKDGGMQPYLAVPVHLLLPAPGLSPEAMAIVEPLAIGAHAVRRAQFQPGETALVIGCGPIGIGIIRFAQLAGAEVIVMDLNEQRLQYCREVLGVTHAIQAGPEALDQIRTITQGDLVSAVFDATGSKAALEAGVQYLAPGGRYLFVGLTKGELSFHHPSIHAKEASLLCSRNATHEDLEHVIATLQAGQFPIEAYITHRIPSADIITEFPRIALPETGAIKAVTIWGE